MNSWAIARRAFGTDGGFGVIVPSPCGAHARIHDPATPRRFITALSSVPAALRLDLTAPAPTGGHPVPATDGRLFGTVPGAPRPGNNHAGPHARVFVHPARSAAIPRIRESRTPGALREGRAGGRGHHWAEGAVRGLPQATREPHERVGICSKAVHWSGSPVLQRCGRIGRICAWT